MIFSIGIAFALLAWILYTISIGKDESTQMELEVYSGWSFTIGGSFIVASIVQLILEKIF